MSSRSLNKVMLIGNLTRDPEMRYTPNGAGVCSFGLATNRSWQSNDGGERKEETEFHRIVAWNKLAELCAQLLTKGRKVYIEGRLQTRSWETPDGDKRQATEIVAEDMVLLDSRREGAPSAEKDEMPAYESDNQEVDKKEAKSQKAKGKNEDEKEADKDEGKKDKKEDLPAGKEKEDEIDIDDIPF